MLLTAKTVNYHLLTATCCLLTANCGLLTAWRALTVQ